jgi:hypothetical protein
MTIDINRVAAAAIEAALREEHSRRRRVPGIRVIAAGAALATAARVGQKHLPRLTELRLVEHGLAKLGDVPSLRDVTDSVRERLADHGLIDHDDEDLDDSAYEADEDDPGADEQPVGEAEGGERGEGDAPPPEDEDEDEGEQDEDEEDDGWDDEPGDEPPDEDDERPRAQGSDDDEGDWDEGADDEPRGEDDRPPRLGTETPDLVDVLSSRGSRPPVMEAAAGQIDPAARPPKPVERGASAQSSQKRTSTRQRRRQSTAERK